MSESRLNVLLSAYACEPNRGSEPGVGWNVAMELSSRVNLTVITRANNRTSIEASEDARVKTITWIFWDPPKWLTFWKKKGRGVQLFYAIWQYGVKKIAATAHSQKRFDIIHHITFGKYWVPSRLAGLGCPFVFGPVGGGEFTPPSIARTRAFGLGYKDFAKDVLVKSIGFVPGVKRLYRNASWTFAATEQTQAALNRLGVGKLSVLPQSGIRQQDFTKFEAGECVKRRNRQEILLVSASRLISWKAIDLAIEAVALANKKIDVRMIVLQNGPDLDYLKRLARNLDIQHKIEFAGHLSSLGEVHEQLAEADALIHPALHEAFGQACVESLALGTPVICLNWGGPGMIVDEDTGFAVTPGSRSETVVALSEAIVKLSDEIANGHDRSSACKKRAFEQFDWDRMAYSIYAKYLEIAAQDSGDNAD